MTSQTLRKAAGIEIQLEAKVRPAGTVRVLAHWPGCPAESGLGVTVSGNRWSLRAGGWLSLLRQGSASE